MVIVLAVVLASACCRLAGHEAVHGPVLTRLLLVLRLVLAGVVLLILKHLACSVVDGAIVLVVLQLTVLLVRLLLVLLRMLLLCERHLVMVVVVVVRLV